MSFVPRPPCDTGPRRPSDPSQLIVLAGGSGRRLRRVARTLTGRATPKQFCRFGRRSLLQETIERMLPLIPAHHATVVVTGDQAQVANEQLEDFGVARVVVQPEDRGTAVGLLLPLLDVYTHFPDATVVVTPSDHGYSDAAGLRGVLDLACRRAAEEPEEVALLGVRPDAPRCDFGWIVPRDRVSEGGFGRVACFEEKPRECRAIELMASGGLFNTLVLVAKAEALLALFDRFAPALLDALEPAAFLSGATRRAYLEQAFAALPPVDLSRDILARAVNLVVCALDPSAGWTDLGDEDRLLRWLVERGDHAQVERIRRSIERAGPAEAQKTAGS